MGREENLQKALEILRDEALKTDSLTAIKHLPAQEGRYEEYPEDVHPALVAAFKEKGYQRLYIHQHACWKAVKEGGNPVVVTPTASGKTLCYNLPVLDTILKDPSARAMYLFPTKALANDQRAELDETIARLPEEIRIFTYDGDTPQDARRAIRARGHIVLTNPDMLHAGILPHHTKWIKLFENLKYVIIDELHNYRGIFGSHLANVLRRLKRVAAFYGANPQFILCTATIANPLEMAEKMIEAPAVLIDDNGAPRGEKYVIFYCPPVVNQALGIRRSYVNESRRVASIFLHQNLQTIVFAQSRLVTEVLLTYLKEDLERTIKQEGLIRGYRGGYLPIKRREIEKGLREGKILGVVSTNALELGIDIGTLDVAVLASYPGTIASTWQRIGRAGRKIRSLGRGPGRLQRAARPVHHQQSRLFLLQVGRAGSHQSGQPDHPHQPRRVRRFRAALSGRGEVRPGRDRRNPQVPRGGKVPPPRQGQVVLDAGRLPGRRRQPPVDLLGQLRRRRHDRENADHRRSRFHRSPDDAAREGHLHLRGRAVLRREARLHRAQGLRQEDRYRLLHRRHRLHENQDSRRVR